MQDLHIRRITLFVFEYFQLRIKYKQNEVLNYKIFIGRKSKIRFVMDILMMIHVVADASNHIRYIYLAREKKRIDIIIEKKILTNVAIRF